MGRGIRFVVALLAVGFSTSTALAAEDETVVRRLTKHGQLPRGQAQALTRDVSKRMKQAADMTASDDPLRMAMSRALYGAPNSKDAMAAAKIRLRLYAGLNEWALDNLFAPRPGALAHCQQELKLSSRQCDALVAASGRISVEEASKLGGGAGNAGAPVMAAAPAAAPQQPVSGRFQRYDSGYAQGRPAQRPTAQPVARPMQPMPAARPMPQPTPVAAANTKNEYQARRAAYLERQRQQMEARKAKLTANVAGAPVQRGPASAEEAEVAGLPVESAAPAGAAPAATQAKAPASEPVAAAEPAADAAPALDEGLLDSLLADPLGK